MDLSIEIDLSEQCIRLEEQGVCLRFATDDQLFYLLLITLVALEMESGVPEHGADWYVPFVVLRERLRRAAGFTRVAFDNDETMAKTVYHAWRYRLVPGASGCKYEPSRKLSEDEELLIEALFQMKAGAANERAAFRLSTFPDRVAVKGGDLLDRVFPPPKEDVLDLSLASNIPDKPYYTGLSHHAAQIQNAAEILRDESRPNTVLFWGFGGLGKSTLAAELARDLLRNGAVSTARWVQMQVLAGDGQNVFETVITSLIAQLGMIERINAPLEAKLASISSNPLLTNALLIIDNVDAADVGDSDFEKLLQMLPVRYIVATTRPSTDLASVSQLKVSPLSLDDAEYFVRTDAIRRSLEHVLPKKHEMIRQLCKVTGCCPFALQLAVGRATRTPWATVVERIRDNDEHLYEYLFRDLWGMLDELSQKVFVYFRTSPDALKLDEILAMDLAPQPEVLSAMDFLVRLSLVDTKDIASTKATYCIHPLAAAFLASDLRRLWDGEDVVTS